MRNSAGGGLTVGTGGWRGRRNVPVLSETEGPVAAAARNSFPRRGPS